MSICDNCNKEKPVARCEIKDKMGTRYRNLCNECIAEWNTQSFVNVLDLKTENTSFSSGLDDIMLTTSPSFEGYHITEYKGIIFDETITGIGLKTAFKSIGDLFSSLTGDQMFAITERITELKNELINRLKSKAFAKGANAIISVDFESTMPGGNAIMVSANGTAVVIEKSR